MNRKSTEYLLKRPESEKGCTGCKPIPSCSCTAISKEAAMGYAPYILSCRETFLQYQGVQAPSKASWPDPPWNHLLGGTTEIHRAEQAYELGKQDAHS